MAEVKIKFGPFKEQVEFFKAKVPMESGAYTDLLHEMHDKGFVIAGVTETNFLTDVHDLLVKAMEDGTPFEQWQKNYRKLVETRWLPDLKTSDLSSGWRARTIYQTNMRTAYAAGRYEQMQRIKKTHPYWRYRHGDSKKPRLEHVAWDGVVLECDDQWWDTHFPPNGWGCSCYVEPVSKEEYEDMETKDKKRPRFEDVPPEKIKFGDRITEVPKGIEKGWAYTPGRGNNQGLLMSLAQSHPKYAAQAWVEIGKKAVDDLMLEYWSWANRAIKDNSLKNECKIIGFMDLNVLAEVRQRYGFEPPSASFALRGEGASHMYRSTKPAMKAVSLDDVLNLPAYLNNPLAIIVEKDRKKNPNILTMHYIFKPEGSSLYGKIIIKSRHRNKINHERSRLNIQLNEVITAGLVDDDAIKDASAYDIIWDPNEIFKAKNP
jgi:SPP1 gp7 family putative phage head morphogenesis protein